MVRRAKAVVRTKGAATTPKWPSTSAPMTILHGRTSKTPPRHAATAGKRGCRPLGLRTPGSQCGRRC
eukprot:9327253-Alexandrium_andersonii.AAC.1